jgi:hypothetical protein
MNMHVNGTVHHLVDHGTEIVLRQHRNPSNDRFTPLYNKLTAKGKGAFAAAPVR